MEGKLRREIQSCNWNIKKERKRLDRLEKQLNKVQKSKPLPARKYNPCFFCGVEKLHMARHLSTMHSENPEVMQCLELPKNSRARREAFEVLLKQGRAKLNHQNHQKIKLKYEKKMDVNKEPAWPCPHCGDLYFQVTRHEKTCPSKKGKSLPKGYVKSLSKKIWQSEDYEIDDVEKLIKLIKEDQYHPIMRNDKMIRNVIEHMRVKWEDFHPEDLPAVKNRLTYLARFLIEFRKINGLENNCLIDVYSAELPQIREAVQSFSKNYEHPHTLDLLHNHLMYAITAWISAVTLPQVNEIENLKKSFSIKWKDAVAPAISKKKNTLAEKNVDKNPLPLKSDFQIFHQKIDEIINKLTAHSTLSFSLYKELCEALVAKITVFNFRRANEVAKMKLKQFESRREEGNGMEAIVLQGKSQKNKLVKAYINKSSISAIQKLINAREYIKEIEKNEYVFGLPNGKRVNGQQALNKMAKVMKLKNFNANNLRDFIATEMWENGTDQKQEMMLEKHMGHTKEVHKNSYIRPFKPNSKKTNDLLNVFENLTRGVGPSKRKENERPNRGNKRSITYEESSDEYDEPEELRNMSDTDDPTFTIQGSYNDEIFL